MRTVPTPVGVLYINRHANTCLNLSFVRDRRKQRGRESVCAPAHLRRATNRHHLHTVFFYT